MVVVVLPQVCVFGVGLFGWLGQIFMTQGFQIASDAGAASIARYTDVLCAFLWDLLILGEHLAATSFVGQCRVQSAVPRSHWLL